MAIASINPATGEKFASFDPLSPEKLEEKLATCAQRLPRTSPELFQPARAASCRRQPTSSKKKASASDAS